MGDGLGRWEAVRSRTKKKVNVRQCKAEHSFTCSSLALTQKLLGFSGRPQADSKSLLLLLSMQQWGPLARTLSGRLSSPS